MMNQRKKSIIATIVVLFICLCVAFGITSTCANEETIEEQESKKVFQTELTNVADKEEMLPVKSVNPLDLCDEYERYLLAKIAMTEAEGEDIKGKALVILVVINRVESDSFPDTVEEVIFQKNQFSPLQDGRWEKVEPDEECWEALEMISDNNWDESNGATYFESNGKSNWHRKNLEYLFRHGKHYFYTEMR